MIINSFNWVRIFEGNEIRIEAHKTLVEQHTRLHVLGSFLGISTSIAGARPAMSGVFTSKNRASTVLQVSWFLEILRQRDNVTTYVISLPTELGRIESHDLPTRY